MADNHSLARVGILGYGVIGRRLATAIARQPDMMLVGVAGRRGSVSLIRATSHGYHTYMIDRSDAASGGVSFRYFVSQLDALLDCTPSGVPSQSRQWLEPFPELIPETIDCIRSALRMESDPWRSIWLTDQSLGIAQPPIRYRSPVNPSISV